MTPGISAPNGKRHCGEAVAFSLRLERREVEKRIYGVEASAVHGFRLTSMATSYKVFLNDD